MQEGLWPIRFCCLYPFLKYTEFKLHSVAHRFLKSFVLCIKVNFTTNRCNLSKDNYRKQGHISL